MINTRSLLVDVEDYLRWQATSDVVCIDVRDPAAYLRGHIPGAVNVPEFFEYNALSTPAGEQDLRTTFQDVLGRVGLAGTERVVVYEDAMDSGLGRSCRAQVLLQHLGFPEPLVLHGGLAAWRDLGLAVDVSDVTPAPRTCVLTAPPTSPIVTKADILATLDCPDVTRIDVRNQAEWDGVANTPSGIDDDLRLGRLPNARWLPWTDLLDLSGAVPRLLPSEQVRERCQIATDAVPDSRIQLYCYKGAGQLCLRCASRGRLLQRVDVSRLLARMGRRPRASDRFSRPARDPVTSRWPRRSLPRCGRPSPAPTACLWRSSWRWPPSRPSPGIESSSFRSSVRWSLGSSSTASRPGEQDRWTSSSFLSRPLIGYSLNLTGLSAEVKWVVALGAILLLMRAGSSSMVPSISAALLPILLDFTSVLYPLAVAVTVTTVILAALVMRENRSSTTPARPPQPSARLLTTYWMLGSVWGVAAFSLGIEYAAVPPILVAGLELMKTRGAQAVPKAIVLASSVAAGVATHVLISSWVLDAVVAFVAVSLICKAGRVVLPPAYALGLLPLLLATDQQTSYLVAATLGSVGFVAVTWLWTRVSVAPKPAERPPTPSLARV